jgi:hypothetical protein
MSDPEMRVGNGEREAAQRLLEHHFQAGRLDPHEYEDRRGRAGDAVTRGELDALFTDLPGTTSDDGSLPVQGTSTDIESSAPAEKSPASARRGAATGIVAIAAVALFFITGRWQWFLLVPVVALLWTFVTGRDD